MTAAYTAPARIRHATTDREAAREALETTYLPHGGLQVPGDQDCDMGSDTVTAAGGLSLARLWNAAPVHAQVDRVEDFLGVVTLGAGLELHTQREDLCLDRGDCAARYSTEQPLHVRWAGAQVVVLGLPRQPLQAAFAARLGPHPTAWRFTSIAPASGRLARYWRGLVAFVERELRADDSVLGHPLVEEQAKRMLAEAALSVFPNPAMSPHDAPGHDHAAQAVVRRAIAFIDGRAHLPLTVQEVASAAGIGVRGLQQAFAQHVGTSPLGYARRVRLEQAHRELQAADPAAGATVSGIAARWGFANPGRFAGLYVETFGVPPSQTLRG